MANGWICDEFRNNMIYGNYDWNGLSSQRIWEIHACNEFTAQKTVDIDRYGEETNEADIPNSVLCLNHQTAAELSADPIGLIHETLPQSMRLCAPCDQWFIWQASYRDHFADIHEGEIPTFTDMEREPDPAHTTEYSDTHGRRYVYNFGRRRWDILREPVRRMGDPFMNFAPQPNYDDFDDDTDGEADWNDEVDDDVEAAERRENETPPGHIYIRPRGNGLQGITMEALAAEMAELEPLVFEPEPEDIF